MDWNFNQLFTFLSFLTLHTIQPSFLLHLPNNASEINSNLTIHNQERIYVPVGASLNQHCLISSATIRLPLKFNCSALFWECDGGRWMNNNKTDNGCISVLNIESVLWFGKRKFRCIYEAEIKVEIKFLTVISGHKPKPISKPKLEWIEDEVDVTWLPNNGFRTEQVKYTVQYYCTTYEYPNIDQISGNCGYFDLNNCSRTMLQCRASFLARLGATYVTRVIAENKFGKQSSEYVRINIPSSSQKMMIKPISKLAVFSFPKIVKMVWKQDDFYDGNKMISYKCEDNILQKNVTKNNAYEIPQNTLPIYKYCLFCVSRQRYKNGAFSCPKCKTVRTAEGVPQVTAQLIPCKKTVCQTVSSGNLRNLTISWRLPEEKYWNGKLRHQEIFYHAENGRKLRNFTINNGSITSWTLGNLKYTEGYYVFMVICTLAGCSDRSNTIYIQGTVIGDEIQFKLFSDGANSGLLIGVPLAILGVGFVIIFVILYLKRREGDRLPVLEEPHVDTNTSEMSPLSNEEEYNALAKNEEEYNALGKNEEETEAL